MVIAANDNGLAPPSPRSCAFCLHFATEGRVIGGTTVGWCRARGETAWAFASCQAHAFVIPQAAKDRA